MCKDACSFDTRIFGAHSLTHSPMPTHTHANTHTHTVDVAQTHYSLQASCADTYSQLLFLPLLPPSAEKMRCVGGDCFTGSDAPASPPPQFGNAGRSGGTEETQTGVRATVSPRAVAMARRRTETRPGKQVGSTSRQREAITF